MNVTNQYSMNLTYEILLALLRKSLFNIKYSNDLLNLCSKNMWDDLIKEAYFHHIEPIVLQGAIFLPHDLQPEEELLVKWRNSVLMRVIINEHLISEQTDLVNHLKMAGIDSIILKGTSVSYFYPKPELRPLGDIDILIKKEECDAAVRILRDNGYVFNHEHDFHIVFIKNGVEIELHYAVSRFPENEAGSKLSKVLSHAFENICQCQLGHVQFPSPSPFDNALILLLHMQRHLNKGIGLKQLCDWIMFVNSNLQPELWDELLPFLNETGLKTFAISMTKTGVLFLGLDQQLVPWCLGADDKVCNMLLNEILSSGNMGRKRDNEDKASGFLIGGFEKADGNTYGKMNQVKAILGNFNNSAKRDFPILKKCPVLLPIMWLYIPARYYARMLRGNRPEIATRKLIKLIEEKKDLYEELKNIPNKTVASKKINRQL